MASWMPVADFQLVQGPNPWNVKQFRGEAGICAGSHALKICISQLRSCAFSDSSRCAKLLPCLFFFGLTGKQEKPNSASASPFS
jgi:hypothetical protein